MKTLYLDCSMGAAGDMLAAALLELLPHPEDFIQEINGLGIPGVYVQKKRTVKCGIVGTHFWVTVHGMEEHSHDHQHGHSHCHTHHHGHEHNHDHTHHHGHEHTHDHTHHHGHEHTHDHTHHHGHEHNHDHTHHHGHEHNHDHTYDHGHEHTHDHTHHHGHEHTHDHPYDHGHEHSHHHHGVGDIEHMIRTHLSLPEKVKADVIAVYELIAQGESHVHGVPVREVHFHEVGAMDAIADIVAVCLLMDKLSPAEVVASPIHVGSGQVQCTHGILPVPAPATAYILRDVPIYGDSVQGELCTPTGAALLKHFVTRFGPMPLMRTQAIGYGMGKKDFPTANCIRALFGETETNSHTVVELSCQVDDMTAEEIGFAMERFFDHGALDVYTVSVGMKKSRPGTGIHVLCKKQDVDNMVRLLFKHTTTIGLRETTVRRHTLDRQLVTLETPCGTIHRKDSFGYGVSRSKIEHDDLSRIAKEKNLSISEVRALLKT